ncbi:GNAT family N-acetyltransferase [Mesobacillus zeae]|uniref:GNAT family N-acetyltransferase n=1 Tax=Mesobacillus zeae TaxID=1917180 RepID=A0A398B4T2_9BACI|nr:GNAT family N-acetyltransferase [Mesobacillus zeae]RID84581.1 GNAT family N-acetyltransferase [Mesobacillus zeae]
MEFILSSIDMIEQEMEIMNSHPEYNVLADGKKVLDEEDLLKEHEEKPELKKERYLLRSDNHYVGIIEFIMDNPTDRKPWLGLLIIHNNWTKKSYAAKALAKYEEIMKSRNINEVRLGCFTANITGMNFWGKQGFRKVKEITFHEKPLWIMEKALI